jgi:class 3 adenylate cyclase
MYEQLWKTISSGQSWHSEFHNRKKNGELFWELASISPIFNAEGIITHYVAVKEDITERKLMEEALQHAHDELEQRVQERTADLSRLNETLQTQIEELARQERQREAILTVAMALRTAPSRSEMVTILLEQVGELLQADGAVLLARDPEHNEVMVEQAYGIWEHLNGARVVEDDGSIPRTQDSTEMDQQKVARRDAAVAQSYLFGTVKSLACIPLIAHDWSIGTLGVGCQHVITRENMRLLSAIGDMIANALRRATLHEQTERRMRHLQALHAIDEAITTSLDLVYTLDVVLEQVMSQLHIDAVAVLLVAEHQGQLVYKAGRGFTTEGIQQRVLPFNEGYVGQAAQEGRIITLEDIEQTEEICLREDILREEGFVSYYEVPLIARGQVKGVLELFHRSHVTRDDEWHNFMKTLAGQASIAIDNADVVAQLQQRTNELARLNEAYECFVPREFLGLLNKGNIVEVQLGDQVQRNMTVMFADIRAFTALSEQMTPEENFAFINTYLSRVSPVIRQYHGFIDKYIGDAIMALFPDQAEDALEASIVMLREISRYNVRRQQHGNEPITVGIGLHTGSLMLGIIGEEQRKQGTVIADAVNLSSRLEGLTKVYGAAIIVSEQTLFSLSRPSKYSFRFLGKVRVHGKQDAVAVFDILDGLPSGEREMRHKTLADFEKGLLFYYNREFAEALTYFERVLDVDPDDKAARLYKQRSQHYHVHGVPSDWMGIEILAEK